MPLALALVLYGQVLFGGLPVPGATVTAARADTRVDPAVTVTTDDQGIFRFDALDAGAWQLQIEMLGFAPLAREITLAPEAGPVLVELSLLPFEEIARSAPSLLETASAQSALRAAVRDAAPLPPATDEVPVEPAMGAADGLLINGSVNNGATSPFAQAAAFGNNRRRSGAVYNGGIGLLAGNSAWDARPFSFATPQPAKPAYSDVHLLATFGGPLPIPRISRNRPNVFVGFQRTADHKASTQSALMPTAREREGDFSQSVDRSAQALGIVDPSTGLPFAGGVIPGSRISPQAAALLRYYPLPNVDGADGFNYQRSVVSALTQHNLESRLAQPINARNSLAATLTYQRATTDNTRLFGFEDTQHTGRLDASTTWSHRFSQFLTLRLRYQLARRSSETTPYFAHRSNVSGDAGIAGNDQRPESWGPPTLQFASGIAGLADALPGRTRGVTHGAAAELLAGRGRHSLTVGGTLRRHRLDLRAQQDPRGTFTFSGAVTGNDFADFLLGIPGTSSIAFGNADTHFVGSSYETYVNDDWRVSPGLTINAGVRWEYDAPLEERAGRVVNLAVTPEFTSAVPVVGSSVRADMSGIQPRLGVAWRPVAGSSLVVRAGYGIYRNADVYQPLVMLLAQQPPLARAFSVANSAAAPFTLADGFVVPAASASATFAVDPDFRIGIAQNWQAGVQRDLPASLTVLATYLGTRGSRLMQEVLPNTYPAGVSNPCPSCPSGFIYLTSSGRSSRHAAQFELRRRLRSGFTATAQYTLSKAMDDAAAFAGANLSGAVIAQDWLDLDAEYAPSAFDQRHLFTAQTQYTTGIGVAGGALLTGVKGALVKGWTFTMQLSAGSGLPLTALYFAPVRGTGVTGTLRAGLTGVSTDAPSGYYLNPAAYRTPTPGHWGDAGRNSVTGPSQFSLNAGIARTFPWGDRLNLDWRVDATNILNRVTYGGVNALVGSPQFGLPVVANPMRKLQTSLRLRF
jgi:hypothetical protein